MQFQNTKSSKKRPDGKFGKFNSHLKLKNNYQDDFLDYFFQSMYL